MKIFSNLTLICLLITFLSCEEESTEQETHCSSSLTSPIEVEHELISGTCLDHYISSDSNFVIKSQGEFESVADRFECEELPTIDFTKKSLIGTVSSFTGANETNEKFSVLREGNTIELVYCVDIAAGHGELMSHVETYLIRWVTIDQLKPYESVIFTLRRN